MSSKKILTDDLVYEKMGEDGIKEEVYGNDARDHMVNEWSAEFDIDSQWANGHEELIVYNEQTADGYDVYICTDDHDGKININEDLYYYNNGEAFMERALDTLRYGGAVWIDSYIADDMSSEIDEAFETAYEEWYEGKFEEYQDELINDGYELEK
jgi:hypothetical protein